jgi:predicted enzyme related to lactoylglutathione lyase
MILYCSKWELTVRFYKEQIGLPVLFSTDWFVEFHLNQMARLSIADEKKASIKSDERQGVTLALEVEDIETVHEHMKKVGLKPTIIIKHPWNAQIFHLFDPEGHRIEIWQKFADETKDNCVY